MSKHKHKNKKRKNWWKEYGWDWETVLAKLYIEPKAYEKMSYFVQLAQGEISGFGKIKHTKTAVDKWKSSDQIMLEDVEIFEQRCSFGGTTLDGEQLSKFRVWLARHGKARENWSLWWHSHNDFGVCWSGVDEIAIQELTNAKDAELISVCMNKDYDIIARRDRNGTRHNEQLDVRILPRINMVSYDKCERTFKKKVTHVSYVPTTRYNDVEWEKKWEKDWRKNMPLLEYIPTNRVQTITDKDTMALMYRYDSKSGLYIRNRDGKKLSLEELRNELHSSKRFDNPVASIIIPH